MESVDNHLLKALVTRLYKGFCNPPPKNVMYGTSHMFFFSLGYGNCPYVVRDVIHVRDVSLFSMV